MVFRLSTVTTLCAAALMLGACDTVSDAVPEWMGGSESEKAKPKLDGERVSVLSADAVLEPDSSLEAIPIRLAPEEENAAWPQHAGNESGFATTLQIHGALDKDESVTIADGAEYAPGTVIAPVVAAGSVFVMDAEGKISAHRADDISEELWTSEGVANAEEEPMIGGGLAYGDGTLYAVSGNGLAAAFDPMSGRELWRQNILIPVRSAPLFASGKVFLVTTDSKSFALDATTGNIVWEDQGLSEGASFLANASPTFDSGLLAVPYASAELKVVTADEGRSIWGDVLAMTRRNTAASEFSGIGGSPVILNNAIYAVSNAGVLAAYRLDNGMRVWERAVSSANRPWVSGNVLYVLSTDGQLAALNRIDGRVYWVAKLPAYKNEDIRINPYRWSGPVLAGDVLYINGAHGVMKRINAISGEILEDIDIAGDVLTPPIIAGGKMYFVSQDATLHVLY